MRPLKQWQRLDELKRTTTITDCSMTADAHNTKQRHSERPIYGPQYIVWDDTSSYPRKLYSETYQTRWRRRSKRTYYSIQQQPQWIPMDSSQSRRRIQRNKQHGTPPSQQKRCDLNTKPAEPSLLHTPARRLWVWKTPGRQYQYKECP